MAIQTGLSQTWLITRKTGFLMRRLNFGHPLKTKNDVKMINLNKQNIDLYIFISFSAFNLGARNNIYNTAAS